MGTATFVLRHRKGYTIAGMIPVPDGDGEREILIDDCAKCGRVYDAKKATDRFCSATCRIAFNSDKRPRRTSRKK
jgi:hypothetical protein